MINNTIIFIMIMSLLSQLKFKNLKREQGSIYATKSIETRKEISYFNARTNEIHAVAGTSTRFNPYSGRRAWCILFQVRTPARVGIESCRCASYNMYFICTCIKMAYLFSCFDTFCSMHVDKDMHATTVYNYNYIRRS